MNNINIKEMDAQELRILAALKANKKDYIKNLNKLKKIDHNFEPIVVAASYYHILYLAGWSCN